MTSRISWALSFIAGAIVCSCGDNNVTGGGGFGGANAGGTQLGGGGAEAGGGVGASGGAGGAGQPWDPRYDPFVDALMADLEASGAYGVSVAVMEGGEVTFVHAFGSKDAAGTEPLDTESLMQIGSTTKQMTATALLRRVEAGDVSLDDSVEQTLPALEFTLDGTWDDQLLIRQLISHQSGLADQTEWVGTADDSGLANRTYGAFANTEYLMNPSGAFWNYSNPNFVLAGLLAQEFDTRTYPDLMQQDIFLPLGMDRTFLRKAEVEADGNFALSYGYTATNFQVEGEVTMAKMSDSAWLRPAGLAWTTPTQMMQWARFIMHGDAAVLSDEMRAEITSKQVDTLYAAGNLHYGFGMFVEGGYLSNDEIWYETPIWDHGGNTLSFSNEFWMVPETDFAVSIISSAYATDFTNSVAVALTTLASLPVSSNEPPAYVIDPSEFDKHVGDYDDPFNVGQAIVTRDGDTLLISMPDVEAAGFDVTPELQAISSDIFMLTLDGQPFDLTFVPAVIGADSTYIRNRAFVMTRSPGPAAAPTSHVVSRESIEQMLVQSRIR